VEEVDRYIATTLGSRALFQEAANVLPGGDTRTTAYFSPYPLTFASGNGCLIWDVDGTQRIDFSNNFTSLILGHSNQRVLSAVKQQMDSGLGFYGLTETQIRLAKMLCDRVGSVERLRFTNSGTEATMHCVRAARAFTGRQMIAKCEGGYHGSHDSLAVSVRPPAELAGDPKRPTPVPDSQGISTEIVGSVLVLPFNDPDGASELVWEHRNELAAVIVEPILGTGGMIPASRDFLSALRQVTSAANIVLIFDEVISLRISFGGAQEFYNVRPDLTAMGKFLGGGLPIGAFGGQEEIMSLYDPTKLDRSLGQQLKPPIPHSGSFNGNPITMAAGIATLEELTPETYAHLNTLGESLRQGVRVLASELEIPIQVTGTGSLFGIHFTTDPVINYRDTILVDSVLRHYTFLGLVNEGIFPTSHLLGCISSPMTTREIIEFVGSLGRVLERFGNPIRP